MLPEICQSSLLWRFPASASKAQELCPSEGVVSAGPWNLVLGQTLSKLHVWFGAGQLCVLCVLLMLGTLTGLANAAFSVGTAEQRLFSHHLPAGGDRILKGQMLFFPSSAASCCLILNISELHEFCRESYYWVMLLPTKPPKTKLTLLPLTIGLVFWLWVGGTELPSMERVLDYCWAAECPLLLSSVTCQACSLSLIL